MLLASSAHERTFVSESAVTCTYLHVLITRSPVVYGPDGRVQACLQSLLNTCT